MRVKPYTYGGRHRPNYGTQAESRYFVPDIDSTNTISMILKATVIAVIVAVRGFLSIATFWTGLACVCLRYKLDCQPREFRFVAYHRLEAGKRPLVNLLVGLLRKLSPVSDAFEFAYHYRICLRL